jgi:hypothetical protein
MCCCVVAKASRASTTNCCGAASLLCCNEGGVLQPLYSRCAATAQPTVVPHTTYAVRRSATDV